MGIFSYWSGILAVPPPMGINTPNGDGSCRQSPSAVKGRNPGCRDRRRLGRQDRVTGFVGPKAFKALAAAGIGVVQEVDGLAWTITGFKCARQPFGTGTYPLVCPSRRPYRQPISTSAAVSSAKSARTEQRLPGPNYDNRCRACIRTAGAMVVRILLPGLPFRRCR